MGIYKREQLNYATHTTVGANCVRPRIRSAEQAGERSSPLHTYKAKSTLNPDFLSLIYRTQPIEYKKSAPRMGCRLAVYGANYLRALIASIIMSQTESISPTIP